MPAPATHRLEVEVAPYRREVVAAHLWAAGALGVWERPDRLVAWFADRETDTPTGRDPDTPIGRDPEAPGGLTTGLPGSAGVPELEPGRLRWSVEPERDWQQRWKATIGPVRAGRTTIVPTWLAAEHVADHDELTIVLDPGRAFGSGHHATTTLCLELLDELDLAGRLEHRRLADVGCGTGVLAIAAAARGARAQAVDIDPSAVEVTRDNAARNRVEVVARTGSVGAIDGVVDVLLANLVTDVVIGLARELVAACRAELIVSGIAAERCQHALDALVEAGGEVTDIRERDGWIAARLQVGAAHAQRPRDAE